MSIDASVIITNFNKKAYISRAIRSCLKQSLDRGRYEIIVIDDASTDKSRDVIESFGSDILPIYLKDNVGVAEASNIGIRKALGSFIIRVDADDYINENTLLFMTELMIANPDIGFIYSDHIKVGEQEEFIERVSLNTIDKLYRHGAGVMFRKICLEAIGLYDKDLKNAEDFDLLTRYLKNFNGYYLRLPLYRYRMHADNMTNDRAERIKWETKAREKNKNRE
ncbi:MAG: glycosyltransferase [Candidatus Staskawiczbacteria bacterium]|nr:glycosyltransferase [Candidatus Staskawiczbacteria bacterium]